MLSVSKYLIHMAAVMLAVIPVYILLRCAYFRRRPNLVTNPRREGALLFFVAFCVGLATLTVLPHISFFGGKLSFGVDGSAGINLVPFRVFRQTWLKVFRDGEISYFLVNFLGNILMFVPLGLFPMLLWRGIRLPHAVALGFACSLFIELCQLPIARGTDVDDLWLNTLGALMGALLCRRLQAKRPDLCSAFRSPSHN